jgi:hypothetical protein
MSSGAMQNLSLIRSMLFLQTGRTASPKAAASRADGAVLDSRKGPGLLARQYDRRGPDQ